MISIEGFLARMADLDVKLWVDNGKLRCNAPDHVMTPEFQAELVSRKPELLDFFARSQSARERFAIPARAAGARVPLSHGQERIWSLAQMEPGSSLYNVPLAFQLMGELNVPALERSLAEIQKRHQVLCTTFPGDDLQSVHQEVGESRAYALPVTPIGRDLKKIPPEQVQREIRRLLQAEARRPFDLSHGPLWRAHLFRLGPRAHLLSVTMHHIIFDGVSKSVFLNELAAHYRACIDTDAAPPAPPLGVQFADYAVWNRGMLDESAMNRQLAFWQERLSGVVPELMLPNDRPRLPGKGQARNLRFNVPAAFMAKLTELGRQEQASPFILLLTAFMVALNRFSGQEDLIVCSPTANRDSAELEAMIGYFNNIVIMRGQLSGDPSFRELVARVRRLALEAYDNQNVPLQLLAQFPNLIRTPLTRAMFSYQESSSRHLDLPGIKSLPIVIRKDASDFDLALYTEGDAEGLAGLIEYNADIFSRQTVAGLIRGFGRILRIAVNHPDRPLREYPQFGKSLADVEALLTKHPQIDQAVVVRQTEGGRLLAYLVLNEYDVPQLEDIRAYASRSLPDYLVPTSFMPVDQIPLLPDGQVDKEALPPVTVDRSYLRSSYVEPRTELEQSLALIWKRVLWLDHDVGINDGFRELGGHSLLSVQLVTEVERDLGRRVPQRALRTLNTIAELAQAMTEDDGAPASSAPELRRSKLPEDIYRGLRTYTASWDGKRTSDDSVMVGLNTDGDLPALFWCLQRYQELTQLAKYLGPRQPVYGMRSGNRVMVKSQDNINRLAAHYVAEILETQPQGPYLIGGNCQAAKIAFQIASQLKALGQPIPMLFLMEKFIPFAYDGPVALLFGKDSEQNPKRYFARPELGWKKYYTGPLTMTQIPGAHGQFFREPNVSGLTDTIRSKLAQACAGTIDSGDPSLLPRPCQQILPEDACRARIAGPAALNARPGEVLNIPLEVTNLGSQPWQAATESGISVANRWLDKEGKVIKYLDGRTPLPEMLVPEQSASLALEVRAPARTGPCILEVDLIDEGVCWFKERGSSPLQIKIIIQEAMDEHHSLMEKM